MENINRYFAVLERLKFFVRCNDDDISRIQGNLEVLQRYLNISSSEVDNLPSIQKLQSPNTDNNTVVWAYIRYLVHVLITLKDNVNFDSNAKEELVSIQHMNLFTEAVIEVSRYGTRSYMPATMRNHPLFRLNGTNFPQLPSPALNEIKFTLRFVSEILPIKAICSGSIMDGVILEAMASIYYILTSPDDCDSFKKMLTYMWEHSSKEKYFKNLLILKSISGLPTTTQQQLHQDLLNKLCQPGGFKILVQNLVTPVQDNVPEWKRYKIVSNIIARKGHTKEFYENMVRQIFDFLTSSIVDDNMTSLIPAGVITLRNFYLLNDDLKGQISDKFRELVKPLCAPEDLLTGVIAMEDQEFKLRINLFFTCFCGSGFEVLPNEILIKYLPLFMTLYDRISEKCNESGQLKLIIIQCLANREKMELQSIISGIILEDNKEPFKNLHSRISVNFSEKFKTYDLQIVPEELYDNTDLHTVLLKILKASNNNILIYNAFICMLRLLDDKMDSIQVDKPYKIDLINDQDEFELFIAQNFKKNMIVMSCLTDLITFKSFHSQFHENPTEILDFIKSFIKKRTEKDLYNDESDHILPVVLAVLQGFLENSECAEQYKPYCNILKSFLKRVKNIATKHQVKTIISLIENGPIHTEFDQSQYNFARSLMDETQPHLRVYGITLLIKLLNDKNEETIANRHSILAITLHALRDQESYSYLNCVRLLVTLVNVLEAEVLEALSSEYLNENEELDYRLKVGEAVLKVTEDLGPISYKYKDILINCFLRGCKNKINEFRASSFSNLATACRILSYQIHNFFQELLVIVNDILQSETYLPAKRSAVMTLSQLLQGMDHIADFQEFLLPIYRLLSFIIENDKDEITRIHATNGLKSLKEKCKKFLFPEQKLEKEIKIFDIKDGETSKKVNILELC